MDESQEIQIILIVKTDSVSQIAYSIDFKNNTINDFKMQDIFEISSNFTSNFPFKNDLESVKKIFPSNEFIFFTNYYNDHINVMTLSNTDKYRDIGPVRQMPCHPYSIHSKHS